MSSTKQRQPRLRASCDGCFLAKVKCSKARPICSRCLACGIECRYSPSSRAGKPKSDGNNNHGNMNTARDDFGPSMQHLLDDSGMGYNTAGPSIPPDHVLKFEPGWSPTPANMSSADRNNSLPSNFGGLLGMGVEERSMGEPGQGSGPPAMYSSPMPWAPSTDISYNQFHIDMPATSPHMPNPHMRSQSFNMGMPTQLPWADPVPQEMANYSQVPSPTTAPGNGFASPRSPAPDSRPLSVRPRSSSVVNSGSCTCFNVCLRSLQALHQHSSPNLPALDVVLSVNKKAIEGCAAMLGCTRCMSRLGTHAGAMLVATIIGKITSIYNCAFYSHLETTSLDFAASANAIDNALGVSYGQYQFNPEDGKWIEVELFSRELRRLEDLYAKFRDVCAGLSEDQDVTNALLAYLGQSLRLTLEAVKQKKGGINYAFNGSQNNI